VTERKSILLRLDPAVHDALARWAADELRSTNAQIEFILRRALAEAGRLPGNAGSMRGRGRPPKRELAFDDVDGQAAARGLLVLVVHVEAGGAHRLDRLVQRSANIRAAVIGPTVCELDGPIPTLNRSKTLIAINGRLRCDRR
jgi:hypothetical protein